MARTIARYMDVDEVGHGLRNHLDGTSGVRHQIDVSFVDLAAVPPVLYVIECKYINRPIKLAHVKTLKATVDDLAGAFGQYRVAGIIVSRRGIQRGAARFADHYGVSAQTVEMTKPFVFKLGKFVLAGSQGTCVGRADVSGRAAALRVCAECGNRFEINPGGDDRKHCMACGMSPMHVA
jgi:hypothetical protein